MLTVVINHNIKICGGAIWINLGSFNHALAGATVAE
jgi:hypothetical protein